MFQMMRMLFSSFGRMGGMSFGPAAVSAVQGSSRRVRNCRLDSATIASVAIASDSALNGATYVLFAAASTATTPATPAVSSCARRPVRSTARSRQYAISASGPASPSVRSWLFTTFLIWRVQWMSVLSSCRTSSLSPAAAAGSPAASSGGT